ncbi:MAG: hypothetical protein JRJ85_02150, partial [Deltaproteobacteria bacterium]|nr:hypothetical protein [Deltaproteobacteria bacterium]
MKKSAILVLMLLTAALFSKPAIAGPYAPAAGKTGSTAVSKDGAAIIAWATGYKDYIAGPDVTAQWKTPDEAVGPAEGTAFDIVSLGRGGQITLTFDKPIMNGSGDDFAVFENAFSDTFLELAYVEVSSDGVNFFRFDNDSQTPNPIGAFGSVDPTDVDGFAGKYKQGYGTPFDLADLDGVDPFLNVNSITHVRIIDVIGNGAATDTSGDVVYDPYPTFQSVGFDLDAVGVMHEKLPNHFAPEKPDLLSPAHNQTGVTLCPTLQAGAFADDDTPSGDFHYKTAWHISKNAHFSSLISGVTSREFLTSLTMPASIMEPGQTYYWKVKYYDSGFKESPWSGTSIFTVTNTTPDLDADGIPDGQELPGGSSADVNGNKVYDVIEMNTDPCLFVLNTVIGAGQVGIRT